MRLNNKESTAMPETAGRVMLDHCSLVTVQGGNQWAKFKFHEPSSYDRRSPAVYLFRLYTTSPGTTTTVPTPSGIRRHVYPDSAECACHRSYKLRTVSSVSLLLGRSHNKSIIRPVRLPSRRQKGKRIVQSGTSRSRMVRLTTHTTIDTWQLTSGG